ncbi:MAG: DUF885 family protein, partial [Erysipelotrichaceae bacterium]|nr:DUF885 family protein [Erysipelotrichaceae bacterium]
MKKQLLSFALVLTMSACSAGSGQVHKPADNNTVAQVQAAATPNKEFTQFLEEDFKDTLENDYTTLHQNVADPEKYGFDMEKVDVTLGDFLPTEEDKEELAKTNEKLKAFDYETLDKKQQELYDEYIFTNALAEEVYSGKYDYLDSIWSPMSAVHSNLVNYFSNYELYTEDDIPYLIELIEDVPTYCEKAIDYSKKQAEEGLLRFDYDETMSSLQDVIDAQEDSVVRSNLDKEVDELGLDPEKAEKYKKQIHEALDKDYSPSFTYLKDELEKLKDYVEPVEGLATLDPEGKAYYAHIVKAKTGTNKSVEEVHDDMVDQYNDAVKILRSSDADFGIETEFTSPEEILDFLNQHYSEHFPEIDMPEYGIETLSNEQSQNGIVAYYVSPCIDQNTENRIRFNARDYGKDPSEMDIYQTFAHEGIPGHMYQINYTLQNRDYDIESLFGELGFQEGYATYIENRSLYYLDVDKDVIEFENAYADLEHALICLMDIDVNYNGFSLDEF